MAQNLSWVSPLLYTSGPWLYWGGREGTRGADRSEFFPSIFIEVLPYRRNIFIQPLDATKRPIQVLLNRKQASVDINVQ